MEKFKYRLGLDLGTNSIGWCILSLDNKNAPQSLIALNSRIFSDGRDPKSKSSLAVNRREARGARRRRDRYLRRRQVLMNKLMDLGLMPKNEKERRALVNLNPYELRAKALDHPLTAYELGRTLFHLNQRRGFKSNRKTTSKEETKKTGPDIQGLQNSMRASGTRTLGEYLWSRNKKGLLLRGRPGENLYPTRAMYWNEFEAIQKKQNSYHTDLKPEDWVSLRDHIFYQRELKPVVPGRCQLNPQEFRTPRALPCYQKFTIAQDLTNLEIIRPDRSKHHLTAEQRQLLWKTMNRQKTIGFGKIKTLLNLGDEVEFNLQTDRRKELKGNHSACLLAKNEYFGEAWYELAEEMQDEIVDDLLSTESEDQLIEKAMNEWRVNEAKAISLSLLGPEDFLPGYGRFSKDILQSLMPLMRDDGMRYDEAVEARGFHHSHNYPDNIDVSLEYYGKLLPEAVMGADPQKEHPERKYGKIGNPTVHIGLNQLRKVVNEIIKRYGLPDEIVLELVRDLKLNQAQKEQLEKEQRANQRENEDIAKELGKIPVNNNRENRIKYKLWKELNFKDPNDRCCPYSGERICPSDLFSEKVEIEHILPESVTLDNSINNKTICTTHANRLKGNRSPHEAFGHADSPYLYEDILDRARNLPGKKRWRFQLDAMERFKDMNKFLDRQLNDTAYLSKVAKRYLSHICPHKKIWVIPGRLTAYIRERLGLNEVLGKRGVKNRDDHRHHAIDALVAGLTDRRLLQKIRVEDENFLDKVTIDAPWNNFYQSVKKKIDSIVVSHRPDASKEGALHEMTAYGKLEPRTVWEEQKKQEGYSVIYRKPLTGLSNKEIQVVRDPGLRERLAEETKDLTGNPFKDALNLFSQRTGIIGVRILKKEHPLVEIRHPIKNPRFNKWLVPGKIHHVAVWRMPDGKIIVKGVNVFKANQKDQNQMRPHPAAKRLLKIHKGDLLKLLDRGIEKIARVVSLSPENNNMWLVDHHEAGVLANRYKNKEFKYIFLFFSQIKEKRVRKIFVDCLGNITDPGPLL